MNGVKLYIIFTNIALLVLGVMFIGIGYSESKNVFSILGAVLTVYGIFRLIRMLKAAKQRDDNTLND